MPSPLPDPLLLNNGQRLTSPAGWPARRAEIFDLVIGLQYGGLPPAPQGVRADELITHQNSALFNARHSQYHIWAAPDFSFLLDLLVPESGGPFPVVITGDLCWRPLADEVNRAVLERGYALAAFSRVECAPDHDRSGRTAGIYRLYPQGEYGALAAWAWGYSRCIDFLLTQEWVNPAQICITGHSRGGKAALLAGAVDERVALTVPNDSGCGGAGSYLRQGEHSETLEAILDRFPYWFGPRLKEYYGRAGQLPFDQHFVKALVAPRALLTTEALDDLWANPSGTWLTHQAVRPVYQLLGAEQKLGLWYRPGGHSQGLVDWLALLEFADHLFHGKPLTQDYSPHPFPELR